MLQHAVFILIALWMASPAAAENKAAAKGRISNTGQPTSSPNGPSTGSTRVRRGGSWQYGDKQTRTTWRSSGYPDDRALDLGFRLALSPEQ